MTESFSLCYANIAWAFLYTNATETSSSVFAVLHTVQSDLFNYNDEE